ncbi:MAG: hypothetical protein R2819_03475 [Allomuricauda sp.]
MKKQLIFGHLIPLLIGGLIYTLFRAPTVKMFAWYENLGFRQTIDELRKGTIQLNDGIANWILFSLPDGLWIFSYVSLILLIWKNSISRNSIIWVLLIPILAVCSEIGQCFNLVPGVFDLIDFLFYFLGMTLPFVFYKQSITLKFQAL